jgi:hypothetical protein
VVGESGRKALWHCEKQNLQPQFLFRRRIAGWLI